VTWRSSLRAGGIGVAMVGAGAAASTRLWPQTPQKRLPSGLLCEQLRQTSASAAPQPPQKRMPEGLSKVHWGHLIGAASISV
jgi:hypothetical protein